ncbi:MAG: kynureninase [Pseudomonadales bacterium]|nr:kynureninase [Pseudomonadales bacterium]
MKLAEVLALDAKDPLAHRRDEFELPEATIYLDGNSLGCLPKAARLRAGEVVVQQWGQDLIKSWNQYGWMDLPLHVGEKIAGLIGAAPGQTICCDSISVNLFKLLSAAIRLQPGRSLILSTQDNFPSDLYIVQGLSEQLGADRVQLKLVEEDAIEQQLDERGEQIAVLLLTQVNFRTGHLLDMARLTRRAHELGILVLWDLAHSVGVIPIALDEYAVDFAVGCSYKYLNGGPGAPGFLYVASRHQAKLSQPLSGWMGHESPFDFSAEYRPAPGIARFLTGTPPVLSMSVLDAALEVFREIDVQTLRDKSLALAELFIVLVQQYPVLSSLLPAFPQESCQRGAQLAYRHPQAYAICQALITAGVVADFRAPDMLRFGFSPLYLRYEDIWYSVERLVRIMTTEAWRDTLSLPRSKVT